MADQRPIGYWLTLVDRLLDERFALTLEEHGVTRRQWQLLELLRRGPSPVDELDRALAPFLRPATDDRPAESATEHLAELVESGWVVVDDAAYSLAERGEVATVRLEEVIGEQRSAVTEGVTEEDYERTVATLRTVAGNLGWAEPS